MEKKKYREQPAQGKKTKQTNPSRSITPDKNSEGKSHHDQGNPECLKIPQRTATRTNCKVPNVQSGIFGTLFVTNYSSLVLLFATAQNMWELRAGDNSLHIPRKDAHLYSRPSDSQAARSSGALPRSSPDFDARVSPVDRAYFDVLFEEMENHCFPKLSPTTHRTEAEKTCFTIHS